MTLSKEGCFPAASAPHLRVQRREDCWGGEGGGKEREGGGREEPELSLVQSPGKGLWACLEDRRSIMPKTCLCRADATVSLSQRIKCFPPKTIAGKIV